MIRTSAYKLAERYIGMTEVDGRIANPAILAMLTLDATWPEDDAVPWCSAFANFIAWQLRLPRSKSLRARSWLEISPPIGLENTQQGGDVVIIKQQASDPDENTIEFRGHVGFYSSHNLERELIYILGGNQGNSVSVAPFKLELLLGIRRLHL